MTEFTLVLTLTPDVQERLERLAAKTGRSVEDCARLALDEFLGNWEDYLRTVADLGKDEEDRPVLRVCND
jgi:predicted DNA-binding protein